MSYLLTDGANNVEQYPYTLGDLQADNPNTNFPRNISSRVDILTDFNMFKVTDVSPPTVDPRTHTVQEETPQLIEGSWKQIWSTRAATQQEQENMAASLQSNFSDLIQKRLDDFAKTRNYSSILSAVTYEDDVNPAFAQEAEDAKRLRSETWTAAYVLLAEIEAGQRAIPSSISDIENDLPTLAWTE